MKKLTFMFLIFSTILQARLTQETTVLIRPGYYINKNEFKPNLDLHLDIKLGSNTNGYLGGISIKKDDYIFENFNLHYSNSTQIKLYGGYEFYKGKENSPYFEIAYYPVKGYVENGDILEKRDFSTLFGFKFNYDRHEADISLKYIGKVLIIPESISIDADFTYNDGKDFFKSKNKFKIKNIFGYRLFDGYSDDYEYEFLYNYILLDSKPDGIAVALQLKADTNNEFKILDNLKLNFGLLSDTYFIYNKDDKNQKYGINNNSQEVELWGSIDYIYQNYGINAKISNNTLVYYTNNGQTIEIDKYSDKDLKSKANFKFPKNYKKDAQPLFNTFKIHTQLYNKIEYFNSKLKLKNYLNIDYSLYTINDYAKINNTYYKNDLSFMLGNEIIYLPISQIQITNRLELQTILSKVVEEEMTPSFKFINSLIIKYLW